MIARKIKTKIVADDYGLYSAANEAIISLCELSKVDAVSVMIEKVQNTQVEQLKQFRPKVKIGLHLDLFSIKKIHLDENIKKQFDDFEIRFGFFPEYVDGHMHAHMYPIIGRKLIRFLKNQQLSKDFFVRSVVIHKALLNSSNKAGVRLYMMWINYLGCRFKEKLVKSHLKTNSFCWGQFADHDDLSKILALAEEFGNFEDLLFVHPGLLNDKINRISEYNLLKNLD